MTRISGALLAGAALALALAGCDAARSSDQDPESAAGEARQSIVGGVEVVPHSSPWQVLLDIDGSPVCSGVILSEEWVLTVADCLHGATSVQVVAGVHDRTLDEPHKASYAAGSWILHEGWNPSNFNNNIAVLHVAGAIAFNEHVQPWPVHDIADWPPYEGMSLQVSGWGRTSDGSNARSNVLREVSTNVMGQTSCEATYGAGVVNEGVLCGDASGGMGTCNGDSGAPLMDHSFLYGLASFGSSLGCEQGYPNGYTNLIHFRDWIMATTGLSE